MIKNILVVCVGNVCRSPMAEGLLRHALPMLHVSSAGLGALIGAPADVTSIQLMEEMEINIREHRAQQLTSVLSIAADIILVMEAEHRIELRRRFPFTTGKVFLLGEAEKFDIPDPYGKSREAFVRALELIESGVEAWVPRLRALS